MILRRAGYHTVPWANGGGIAHDIVLAGEPVRFRLSLAEIDRDGPFSDLRGYDRTIVLAGGAGFRLRFADSRDVVLGVPGDRYDFRGEEAPACARIEGSVFAFNVMALRGTVRATVEVARLDADAAPQVVGPAWIFVIDGTVRHGRENARRFDTVVVDAPQALTCAAPSMLATVTFTARHSAWKSTRNR